MLNFLPQKNKNQIIFEYLLRAIIFILLIIFISNFILISLFSPAYFFVKFKNRTINSQLEQVRQKNINKGDDPIEFIRSLNRISLALSIDPSSDIKNSDIIKKIISLKNKNIQILSINIDSSSGVNRKISINGISKTRDSLTLFDKEIKTDGFFRSVVFPVSNFIKSSNSDFSATLTI